MAAIRATCLVGFFESPVSSSKKKLMVCAMNPTQSHTKKVTVSLKSVRKKKLENVVILKSAALFELMVLLYGFLLVNPDMWEEQDAFKTNSLYNECRE